MITFRKHRHEYIWQNKLATLPYGAECAALWESSSVDGAAANEALTCFAVSQDVSLGPLERFNALETSLRSLVSLCQGQPPSLRLASLARVANDYGARSIAVEAIRQLLGKLVRDKWVDMGEPFVPPGKRFDNIAPRNNIQDWISPLPSRNSNDSMRSRRFTPGTALEGDSSSSFLSAMKVPRCAVGWI